MCLTFFVTCIIVVEFLLVCHFWDNQHQPLVSRPDLSGLEPVRMQTSLYAHTTCLFSLSISELDTNVPASVIIVFI